MFNKLLTWVGINTHSFLKVKISLVLLLSSLVLSTKGQSTRRHFFEVKSAPIRWIYGPNVEGEIRYNRVALLGGFQRYERDFYIHQIGWSDSDIQLEDADGEMNWIGLRLYFPKENGVDFFVGAKYRHKNLSFNRLNEFNDNSQPSLYSNYKEVEEVTDVAFLTLGYKFTRSILTFEYYFGLGYTRTIGLEATYESFDGHPYSARDYNRIFSESPFFTFGLNLGLGW